MGFLNTLTNQLGNVLRSQSTARRLMLVLVALASLGGLAYLAFSAKRGAMQVLYPTLPPGEAIEAMAKLRQVGIDAQLDNNGTTLKAPSARADEALMLLAMEGIPGNGVIGLELMDKSTIGQTKFQQEKNYHRMREGELARTLLSIREIEHARVHLALPNNELFVKEEKPATASVVLKMRRGAQLSERQISGIVHLVAHGIEGLQSENVSIIDQNGNLLNPPKGDEGMLGSVTQQAYKTQYEELLKGRIESMLEPIIGRGKVAARVQAEFDFAKVRRVKETFNPDEQDQIVRMQKTQRETSGTPAEAAKTATASTSVSTPGQFKERNEQTTEYDVSKTWEESDQSVPTPVRLTVAVLVDGAYEPVGTDAQGQPKLEFRPRSPEDIAKIENLVKNTIGFTNNDKRQDDVKVECAQFKLDEQNEAAEPFYMSYPVRQWMQLSVPWVVTLVIGLLLVFLVLRPAMRQIMVTAVPAGAGGHYDALPAPAGGLRQMSRNELDASQGNVPAALRGGEGPLALNMGGMSLDDIQLDESEIPEELRGNQEAIRMFKLQKMAAQQARLSQAQSQNMHEEVITTAKANPQKTVSLLRQWMDEA